ncbi:maestro heat-like repeat-containing protein family member 7 [Podargus strigoides]
MYQWLSSNMDASTEQRLEKDLLELTHTHAHDVVVTLLQCAPSCDRAAATMWRVMVSTRAAAEKVLLELLCVLEDWPLHSTSISDGDSVDICALAATRALWQILQARRLPKELQGHFPRLFLALLFQVLLSTEQIPEEVNTFWNCCQEEGTLPVSPNRFVMLTVKALLRCLGYEDVMFAVEHKCGWDTLLNAETHHYAMGLLAREICGMPREVRSGIIGYLVELLSWEEPCCEVSAMAFLVELLPCWDIRRWDDCVLQLAPRYLQSESRVMRHLVLRGLVMFCEKPWTAKRMGVLLRRLIELLQDADMEVVEMALYVIRTVLLDGDLLSSSPIALELAERLRLLFDNVSSDVQLLSIGLFQDVMEFVAEVGKEALKTHVRQSLVPLLCRLHDENQYVAQASQETLLQAAQFLKKRKLRKLLEREQTWAVDECLPIAASLHPTHAPFPRV